MQFSSMLLQLPSYMIETVLARRGARARALAKIAQCVHVRNDK